MITDEEQGNIHDRRHPGSGRCCWTKPLGASTFIGAATPFALLDRAAQGGRAVPRALGWPGAWLFALQFRTPGLREAATLLAGAKTLEAECARVPRSWPRRWRSCSLLAEWTYAARALGITAWCIPAASLALQAAAPAGSFCANARTCATSIARVLLPHDSRPDAPAMASCWACMLSAWKNAATARKWRARDGRRTGSRSRRLPVAHAMPWHAYGMQGRAYDGIDDRARSLLGPLDARALILAGWR